MRIEETDKKLQSILYLRKRGKTNFRTKLHKGKNTTNFVHRVLGIISNRFLQEDERHL